MTSSSSSSSSSSERTLQIRDSATQREYAIRVVDNFVRATDLAQVVDSEREGLRLYDPSFFNTAMCSSRITYIDGDRGILRYRGYNIAELARHSTFLEVAFLLIYGHLPRKAELAEWQSKVMTHTFVHENLTNMMKTFRYDAHPMGMVISSLAAMATFYPEANAALHGTAVYQDARLVNTQIFRIIGKLPTIAAAAYRHRVGRPYNLPATHLSYTANLLYMMDRLSEPNYEPDPRLAKALDVMFILHADHELNCSTAAMRHVASAGTDPVTAVAAAAAALYGPLHGGANEAALKMLERIGSVANVPAFVERVKRKEELLMGFGHRVYKSYDPRASIIKAIADEVFEICGRDELIEVATALEATALSDPYFIERKLYPNVDFYSGLIYKAIGFPTDFFPVLFCIPRTVGWLAHWVESLGDKEAKISRPRQWYKGEAERPYVPVHQRADSAAKPAMLAHRSTGTSHRQTTAQRSRASFLTSKL
jgi:citrate synthase